ncbi:MULTISPECIES: DUF3397 family protein [Aerococcus]|uniref:DUF3397 family protein n=1 Tax=Aerococcus sanguinicola TaxID=119206 RepID=A0A5N1GKD3_9LACT|nr:MULTISPECIES: DUF3397 family protein [Aerococcus]KAA9300864.1 DUF3397 family protein [Aerococcus sanguinicola]MDK6369095.1 DUF3397 family protein [Aerococcus sp. UMB9870]MDK6679846.1 DUF3397 family protein [Aerococcus sp. UMB8608]MDK6686588.1 DUF3397 family protein [Aerococcus sp. UMB8623]MDK6939768.1 DUF3397 family protein [Aerococcus sp. UMB8487]
MEAFTWFEIILYILPILTIILVAKYGKPYLTDGKHINLVVIDVVHPILWLCFHLVSQLVLHWSFLPIVLAIVSVLALAILAIQFRDNLPFTPGRFLRRLSNLSFIIVFLLYYGFVFYRIFALIFA